MNPRLLRPIVVMAAALTLGSCSESARPPAAPSTAPGTANPPPAPKLAELSIVGAPASVRIGTFAQLRAVSRADDGTFQDVTAQTSWQSSDANVCAVNAAGLVEARGAGTTTLSVSYAGLTGKAALSCGFVISALVHENAPTANVAIPGARLEVVGGPLDSRTFETDASGRVALPPVAGPGFALYVKKAGYDDRRLEVFELPRQETLDLALMPAPTVRFEAGGVCDGRYVGLATYEFTTTRESRVRLSGLPGVGLTNVCSGVYAFAPDGRSERMLDGCAVQDASERVVAAGTYSLLYGPFGSLCPAGSRWGVGLEHIR